MATSGNVDRPVGTEADDDWLSAIAQVIAALDQPATVHDVTGVIRACNDAALELFGLTADVVVGSGARRPLVDMRMDDGRPLDVANSPVHAALADGFGRRDVGFSIRNPSEDRWVAARMNVEPIVIGGRVVAAVTYVEPAPEERGIGLLREAQSALGLLASDDEVMLFVKDLEGRYLWVNEAVAALTGRPPENLRGVKQRDVLPAEVAACCERSDPITLQRRRVSVFEEHVEIDGTLRHVLTIKIPLIDAAGEPEALAVLVADIDRPAPGPAGRGADAELVEIDARTRRLVLSALEERDPATLEELVDDLWRDLGDRAEAIVAELLEQWRRSEPALALRTIADETTEVWGITDDGERLLARGGEL